MNEGYTEDTQIGRALRKEDVYTLEDLKDKLDIEDAREVDSLDTDLLITAIQSYQQNLQKAERIIRDLGSQDIDYEGNRLRNTSGN